ncbi:MAG: hypothetical protein JNJ75_17305 [Cyclobacteriaceae bacterium]|nr:hypothetical protein [Cyclobacteriaceae bacterium]
MSSYPCSDNQNHEDGTEQTVSTAEHQHSSDESDQCTPFCVCSCCNTHVNEPSFFGFVSASAAFSEQHAGYTPAFIPSISQSIWQPPKLG